LRRLLAFAIVGAALLAACGESTQRPWAGRADVDDLAVSDAVYASFTPDQQACVDEQFNDGSLLTLVTHQINAAANLNPNEPRETALLVTCLGMATLDSPMPMILAAFAEAMPRVSAPVKLGSVDWPNDAESIASVLSRIADQLGGSPEADEDRTRIAFNDDTRGDVTVIDWSSNTFGPGPNQMMPAFALGADWDVFAAGREGDLIWVHWGTTGDGVPFEIVQWGNVGSPRTYSVNGPNREPIDATLKALVSLTKDG
jgi:hypothetical protein